LYPFIFCRKLDLGSGLPAPEACPDVSCMPGSRHRQITAPTLFLSAIRRCLAFYHPRWAPRFLDKIGKGREGQIWRARRCSDVGQERIGLRGGIYRCSRRRLREQCVRAWNTLLFFSKGRNAFERVAAGLAGGFRRARVGPFGLRGDARGRCRPRQEQIAPTATPRPATSLARSSQHLGG
jgi:hypothetical protein